MRVFQVYGAIGEYSVHVLVSYVIQVILQAQPTASRLCDHGLVSGLGFEFP